MRREYLQQAEVNPKWFKVRLKSVQIADDYQETYTCFTGGQDLESVKAQVKNSMGMAWIVRVKEIVYDEIIEELERRRK